ncbi:MAG: DUF368 domain-containing protein [Bacteroidia bacterium]|nr:DUF368 domain-containing protein [Bacteroidia bacterium]
MIQSALIFLKGLAMGAADVIPGVSGGTIAFITGIYDKLLSSINAMNLNTLKLLRKQGVKAAWKEINGSFLIALFAGIAVSVLSLAKLLSSLRLDHPHLVWGFFFGLVVGSIFLVMKFVKKWDVMAIVGVLVGTAVCYALTMLNTGAGLETSWYLFLAGAIAICAMILPGISGAFLLIILGVYDPVLTAIGEVKDSLVGGQFPPMEHLKVILFVGLGAVVGLLSFSRFLKWLLDQHYNPTIAVLLGFLIGSLSKLWPWKHTIEYRINSHGKSVPLIEENILPHLHDAPQVGFVIGLAAVGFALIYVLSRFSPDNKDA